MSVSDDTVLSPRLTAEGDSTIPEKDPLVGTVFGGRYEILERIGQGGMSMVYRAKHLFMHNLVAIKVLLPNLVAQERAVRRFQLEAKALSSIHHANAIGIHDFGLTESGQPFLVMDLINGKSLSDVIAEEGKLTVERAIPLFVQTLGALEAVHQADIIHRDLKPSNIMIVLDSHGRETVKLVDFGIARIAMPDESEQQQLTKTGEVFGSPPYMSPEQWSGRELDKRADLYSMGCLMYETVSGSAPFKGQNLIQTMTMHLNDLPRRLTDLDCSVNTKDRLEAVLFKALAKEPEERYKSAADLSIDLEKIQDAEGFIGWLHTVWRLITLRRVRLKRSDKVSIGMTCLAISLILLMTAFVISLKNKADETAAASRTMQWRMPARPPGALLAKFQIAREQLRRHRDELRILGAPLDWQGRPTQTIKVTRALRQPLESLASNTALLGQEYFFFGYYDDCISELETWYKLTSELRKDPQYSDMYIQQIYQTIEALADSLYSTGKIDQARRYYLEEAELVEKEYGNREESFHPNTRLGQIYYQKALEHIADISRNLRKEKLDPEATELLQLAYKHLRKAEHLHRVMMNVRSGEIETIDVMRRLADTARRLGMTQEAERRLKYSIGAKIQDASENVNQAILNYYLGDVHENTGRTDEAIADYKKAIELFEKSGDSNTQYLANFHEALGRSMWAQNRYLEGAYHDWQAFLIRTTAKQARKTT